MKLRTLEAVFFRYETRFEPYDRIVGDPATWDARGKPVEPVVGPREYHIDVDTLAEAQAVRFLCPFCYEKNAGPIGTHWINVTFEGRGVLPKTGCRNRKGEDVRWNIVSGTGLDDLTLSPSILIESKEAGTCGWHGFIQNGEAK